MSEEVIYVQTVKGSNQYTILDNKPEAGAEDVYEVTTTVEGLPIEVKQFIPVEVSKNTDEEGKQDGGKVRRTRKTKKTRGGKGRRFKSRRH